MKNNLKGIKSKQAEAKDLFSKEKAPSKLYALCLNKNLIELWALSDQYTNDYYDSTAKYKASIYSVSKIAPQSDDKIPVILSPDDEMMLYNDGLTEYY